MSHKHVVGKILKVIENVKEWVIYFRGGGVGVYPERVTLNGKIEIGARLINEVMSVRVRDANMMGRFYPHWIQFLSCIRT